MKPLKSILFTTCFAGLMILASCESEDVADVNQEKVETTYSLIYKAKYDETTASANFKFGSTYLKLSSPSEVLFNDHRLQEDEVLGIVTYDKTFNGVVEGEFYYRNNDKNVYRNELMLSAVDLPSALKEISMSDLVLIQWIGEPVQAHETVSVHIWNDQQNFWVGVDDINATSVQVRGADIPVELLGQSTIQIDRTFLKSLDQAPEEGGLGKSQWLSQEYSIKIVE